MATLPAFLDWLFWEVDPGRLEKERDADFILARVLEFGGMVEVEWLIETYGFERIHQFFRNVGHPEISERTIEFWRALFHAENETWAAPPDWRKDKSAPWIS